MRRNTNRRAVAIFLVVMVAAVIGVFVAVVMFHGGKVKKDTKLKVEKSQAEFLAKGGQQHFLLKFKLLPTELYDAVSYAVGKNPYFDFSQNVTNVAGNQVTGASTMDAGPMFFTGAQGVTQVTANAGALKIDRAAEGNGIYNNTTVGYNGNRAEMEFLLNHYLLDITTEYPDQDDANKSIVVVRDQPHQEKARLGVADRGSPTGAVPGPLANWRDPFHGKYAVKMIRLLGIGGATAGRKYQADSVLLTTVATVRKNSLISVVTQRGGEPVALVDHKEIKRSVTTNGYGWVELEEDIETAAEFSKRMDPDKSGIRTEIATGVYYISRRAKN